MTKFSVIIPARNEENFICRAIESLQNQTIPRGIYEIIVVDNRSDDDTVAQAARCGADRVVRQTITGTNAARQAGISVCSGKYVAFLDADCAAPPTWLQQIEAYLKAGVDVISGPYDYGMTGIRGWLMDLTFSHGFRIGGPVVSIFAGTGTCPLMGGNFAATRTFLDSMRGLPPVPFYGDDTAISAKAASVGGTVVFSQSLVVKSSPRRFVRDGFFCTSAAYLYHYFRISLNPRVPIVQGSIEQEMDIEDVSHSRPQP